MAHFYEPTDYPSVQSERLPSLFSPDSNPSSRRLWFSQGTHQSGSGVTRLDAVFLVSGILGGAVVCDTQLPIAGNSEPLRQPTKAELGSIKRNHFLGPQSQLAFTEQI